MRNFMFNIVLAIFMLPVKGLAPITINDVSSTNQKYENYLISENKKDIFKEIKEISSKSNLLLKSLDTSYIINDYASHVKLHSIADELGIKASWLLMAFYIETAGTFSTSIENPLSNAIGIIQWMPSTAKYLGTSVDSLKEMSFIDQLDYVTKYVKCLGKDGKIKTYEDLYLTIFYPKAVGKPNWYVIGEAPEEEILLLYLKYGKKMPFKNIVYYHNQGMDKNSDGKLTVKDIKKFATKFS